MTIQEYYAALAKKRQAIARPRAVMHNFMELKESHEFEPKDPCMIRGGFNGAFGYTPMTAEMFLD